MHQCVRNRSEVQNPIRLLESIEMLAPLPRSAPLAFLSLSLPRWSSKAQGEGGHGGSAEARGKEAPRQLWLERRPSITTALPLPSPESTDLELVQVRVDGVHGGAGDAVERVQGELRQARRVAQDGHDALVAELDAA